MIVSFDSFIIAFLIYLGITENLYIDVSVNVSGIMEFI